jgi:hypothetical protein
MPLTMRVEWKDNGPSIGGTPENPRADAKVWVENIDPSYNEGDVILKVVDFIHQKGYATVTFPVPSTTGVSRTTFTLLYLVRCDVVLRSDRQADAVIEWGLITSSPAILPDAGGGTKKPSDVQPTANLGAEYSFDTTGGNRHLTQSIQTRSTDGDSVDTKRAIGIGDGKVEGCDIISPNLRWSITVKGLPVTTQYVMQLRDLTGCVNSVPFWGRQEEELLFLGASLSYKGGIGWEGTFSFDESPNKAVLELAPGLSLSGVRGHDYIWVSYAPKTDTGKNLRSPIAAYCEQVYPTADFELLGI